VIDTPCLENPKVSRSKVFEEISRVLTAEEKSVDLFVITAVFNRLQSTLKNVAVFRSVFGS
jgi:hypothetical protein